MGQYPCASAPDPMEEPAEFWQAVRPEPELYLSGGVVQRANRLPEMFMVLEPAPDAFPQV